MSSFGSSVQLALMPPISNIQAYLVPFVASGAVGYLYWAPMLGASDGLSTLLASYAFARSGAKIFGYEEMAYQTGLSSQTMAKIALVGAGPLAAMYVSSGFVPLDSAFGGLVAFSAYILSAAALMQYMQ